MTTTTTPKFEPGDKVRVLNADREHYGSRPFFKVGDIVTIKRRSTNTCYILEEAPPALDNYGWKGSRFELAGIETKSKSRREFKRGDRVRVVDPRFRAKTDAETPFVQDQILYVLRFFEDNQTVSVAARPDGEPLERDGILIWQANRFKSAPLEPGTIDGNLVLSGVISAHVVNQANPFPLGSHTHSTSAEAMGLPRERATVVDRQAIRVREHEAIKGDAVIEGWEPALAVATTRSSARGKPQSVRHAVADYYSVQDVLS
jgi:hypothetical protein